MIEYLEKTETIVNIKKPEVEIKNFDTKQKSIRYYNLLIFKI